LDGGTNSGVNPSTFMVGDLPLDLVSATKEHYDFDGWYDAATSGTLLDPIPEGTVQNLTLYAYWTPIEYEVNYILDGGTNDSGNPETFNVEDVDQSTISLEDATKSGFTFVGWFDAETGGSQISAIISDDLGSDLTLYARFTECSHRRWAKFESE